MSRIVGAVVCPSTPLLLPGVTGRMDPIPALREACHDAVAELLSHGPEHIVVVGSAPVPSTAALIVHNPSDLIDDARRALAPRRGQPPAPDAPVLPLAVGASLLTAAGWPGPLAWWAVTPTTPPGAAADLGAIAGTSHRTAVLALGGGSACSTLKAPGFRHPEAEQFNRDLVDAVAQWDVPTLMSLSTKSAEQLADLPTTMCFLAGAVASAGPQRVNVAMLAREVVAGVLCAVAELRIAAPP
ncbi:MAG: hypothetical protein KGP10_09265 [Actinomycetales bacterium]|nr:hypothetical protein [Actinomycetales bacterium]